MKFNLKPELYRTISTSTTVVSTLAAVDLLYHAAQDSHEPVAQLVIFGAAILSGIFVPHYILPLLTNPTSIYSNLTGLLNREEFIKRCTLELENNKTSKYHLLLLDLNKFKQINGAMGHEFGDLLLKEIARQITSISPKDSILGHIGGDEFSILIKDQDKDTHKKICTDISASISNPVKINNHWLHTSSSIGVAAYINESTSFTELMRCADIAMYDAKKMQKDYVEYDLSKDQNSIAGLTLVGELRAAIADEDFTLYFQPKKNLKTGEITSIESLVRWIHPLKGIIPPGSFIPLAEQTGMIKFLTQFVIKEAAAAYKTLHDAGYDLKIAVNVSPNDIVDPAMMTTIIKSIVKADMPPEKFVLEVTETAIMHEPDSAFRVLVALDSLGIQLSIDDFGTGHSSLLYLKNFPIDEVKLDRSFIIDLEQSKEGFNIVKSTIDLAHLLNANIVAEGVESAEIEKMLTDLGCDEIQGYHLAKPMPLDELISWLNEYYQARERN